MTTDDFLYPSPEDGWTPSIQRKAAAWFTHFFTATGAVWGLMSIIAITNGAWKTAFVWMALAVFVDSFDGLLARRARVKDVLPNFDGALLDNMIDFLNYVVVPAFFLYQADILPMGGKMLGAAMILIASSYQFCQADAKTDDHFFKGFPSYWNIMVFYLFMMELSPWTNLAITALLSILVFVPVKYVYPSRTVYYQKLTMALGLVWGVLGLIVLITYPDHNLLYLWLSLFYVVYYLGLSLFVTLQSHEIK